jgi:hypothetical protein
MKIHPSFLSRSVFSVPLVLLTCGIAAIAQTCFTSDDMDPGSQSALSAAATRYFAMAARGDTASLKQNSIPAVANSFTGIANTIEEHQADFAAAQAAPRPPFLLKAEGTAPLPKAEFLCGIFNGAQASNSAEFVIPNLPPGTYGVVILDVKGPKSGNTISFVLQQEGTDWKVGGFFLRLAQIGGHDSQWFLDQARAFKAKGQVDNAWLYLVQARELAMPVPFMYTQTTDKLYDEEESVKPGDFPPADLTTPDGKSYKLIAVFPAAVDQDLDLVVRYQVADISNTAQTFQENMSVMKAVVAKYPELRNAFAGIVARAVEPSGRDYGSLMSMKDIK